jgi:hypothetical protein
MSLVDVQILVNTSKVIYNKYFICAIPNTKNITDVKKLIVSILWNESINILILLIMGIDKTTI